MMMMSNDTIRKTVFDTLAFLKITGADAEAVEVVACQLLKADGLLRLANWDLLMTKSPIYTNGLYQYVFQALEKLYVLERKDKPTITVHFWENLSQYGFKAHQIEVLLEETKKALSDQAPRIPLSWDCLYLEVLTREQYLAITIKMGILIYKLRTEGNI